ncbi:hypothetical protein [Nitrosopumilus sp.]|uniref:hypothetical protein n=1 Tax=Nitrosopumilus sp. TaxID=2024843 RepID=UPI00292EAAD3|nr:hypothetical protein [Nitrosopumilus sp.]
MSKQLLKIRQDEPTMNRVRDKPVKERTGFSVNQFSWEDMRGLTWSIMDNDDL